MKIQIDRTLLCPWCQSPDVHRSRRRGALELVVLRPLLNPRRCWNCNKRFYRLTFLDRPSAPTPSTSASRPK